MIPRKWLIRGILLFVILAGFLIRHNLQLIMRPEFARQQILRYFQENYPELDVQFSSAYFRLFGGISIFDLRIRYKKSSSDAPPFLILPHGILLHDKEALQEGKFLIRKLELQRPEIHLEQSANGNWNFPLPLEGMSSANEPVPLLLIQHGKLKYVDKAIQLGPLLNLTEVSTTITIEKKTQLSLKGCIEKGNLGTLNYLINYDLLNSRWSVGLILNNCPISQEIKKAVSHYKPSFIGQLEGLSGILSGSFQFRNNPNIFSATRSDVMIIHEVECQLKQGSLVHSQIPLPIDHLECSIKSDPKKLKIDSGKGICNRTTISLALEIEWDKILCLFDSEDTIPSKDLRSLEKSNINPQDYLSNVNRNSKESLRKMPLDQSSWADRLEDIVSRLSIRIEHLDLSESLFHRLPPKLKKLQKAFRPTGPISIDIEIHQQNNLAKKKYTIFPEGLTAIYEEYPCPINQLRGKLEQNCCQDAADRLTIDLTGTIADQLVRIEGRIEGNDPTMNVDVRIHANGLPLDHQELIDGLPKPYPSWVRRLHPSGIVDLDIHIEQNDEIRKNYGEKEFNNCFIITIRNGTLDYDEFPFPLQQVHGALIIRSQPPYPTRLPPSEGMRKVPDTAAPDVGLIELKEFQASHGKSRFRFNGRKEPTTGGAVLTMKIEGDEVDFDTDLYKALARFQFDDLLRIFTPQGSMNCILQARLLQRTNPVVPTEKLPFNAANDLELNLAFAGPTIEPTFFPYPLNQCAGRIAYKRNHLLLHDLQGHHGKSKLLIPETEVRFKQEGGIWVGLKSIQLDPLIFDTSLLTAMTPGLSKAISSLQLGGDMALQLNHLVIDETTPLSKPRYLPKTDLSLGIQPVSALISNPNRNGILKGNIPSTNTFQSTPNENNQSYPTIFWDGTIQLKQVGMKTGLNWENIQGHFSSRGIFENSHLGIVKANWHVDSALLAKQPLNDINARFEIDPRGGSILQLPMLRGKYFGGEISGEGWISLDNEGEFELKLHGTQIHLNDLVKGQKNNIHMKLDGLAYAQLFLHSPGYTQNTNQNLVGSGSIDVFQGKILHIPVLLDLLKIIKGKPPDENLFEEVHSKFRIEGDRLKISQLDLLGNAISLGGQGEMNIDGTKMKLEFYTIWSRAKNLLSSSMNELTTLFSKAFFKVIVTGDLKNKPTIKKEPVPVLTEPITSLMHRLSESRMMRFNRDPIDVSNTR